MLIIIVAGVNATNYYVSSSTGKNSNNGKTPATAINSISTLTANVLGTIKAGDSIFFKCNDIFAGQMSLTTSGIANNNIYFGSYGTGNKPIITGTTLVNGWIQTSNNIWESAVTDCGTKVNNFFINDIPQQIGRWPNATDANKGYLTFESHLNMNQITDNELTSAINWTGAEAVVRTARWMLDRLTISAHNGSNLIFSSNASQSIYDGFGYFIQNCPKALDVQGEWYYNSTTKKISLFSIIDPNTFITKATKFDNLLVINNINYITINNIEFHGSNKLSLDMNNSSNIYILNNSFAFSGLDAVNMNTCNYMFFNDNTVIHTNNNGFYQKSCNHFEMKNNLFKNTGLVAGMGLGNALKYNAVKVGGKNMLIENNTIDSVGYVGLYYDADSTIIRNNVVSNFCMVKDDGGGIYTWSYGITPNFARKVSNNIVINGIGAHEGTDVGGSLAEGIYCDDKTNHLTITNNTIFNCNKGIYVHNNHFIEITKNIVYNNASQLYFSHDNTSPNDPITNCRVDSNIFVSKGVTNHVAQFNTIKNDIADMGSFNYNYYNRPLDDNLVFYTRYVNGATYEKRFSLSQWSNTYNKDLTSLKSPVQFQLYSITSVLSTNKILNSTFETNTSGWTSWANYSNSQISVATGQGVNGNNALKATFTSPSGYPDGYLYIVYSNISMTAGKEYRLKFSARSTIAKEILQVSIFKSGIPYNSVTTGAKSVELNTSFDEYEILFDAFLTEPISRLNFQFSEGQGDVFLDNVELVEVDATVKSIDECIYFDYNNSKTNKTISLTDSYMDIAGKDFYGSFTLKPFTSILLFKGKTTLNDIISIAKESKKESNFNISPNPASKFTTIKSDEAIQSISIYNMNAKLLRKYNVENNTEYTINNLPESGINIIQVRTKNRTDFEKLIIQN